MTQLRIFEEVRIAKNSLTQSCNLQISPFTTEPVPEEYLHNSFLKKRISKKLFPIFTEYFKQELFKFVTFLVFSS